MDTEERTVETVRAKILRYRLRTQFMANCKDDYAWLKERGLLNLLDELRPRANVGKAAIDQAYVLARAARCRSQSEFQRNYYRAYVWARETGFWSEVEKVLPRDSSSIERLVAARTALCYTDDEIRADAKKYTTRAAWRAAGEAARANGGVSAYGSALHRGPGFLAECCAHMVHGHAGNTYNKRWTDDELIAVAAQYQHKGDWKRSTNRLHAAAYQCALSRRPDVFAQATAHMTPKASPYAGDYVVYAYEFSDNHAYVGLTFQPAIRRSQHAQTGPVFEHAKVCQNPVYKVCQSAIMSPLEAAEAEKRWVGQYRAAGWALLNTTEAGSLGSLEPVKWDKLAVIAEARKYPTKQAWIDGSQRSYRVAKREGWFAEASVHMPKRVLGVGLGKVVSPETRQRQRAAALRRRAVVIA